MQKVALALGSNEGDRFLHIKKAIKLLAGDIEHMKVSRIYETEPVGMRAHSAKLNSCHGEPVESMALPVANEAELINRRQNWFLNCALSGETKLSPRELLAKCKQIEKKLGRDTEAPDSSARPRPIDIDILLYGSLVMTGPNLTIPHPRLHLRKFVLVPLAEIEPDAVQPILKKSAKNLLENCEDKSRIRHSTAYYNAAFGLQ